MLHELKESVYEICQPILDFCSSLGELGLFILAFIESSFFPIPPDFLYIPQVLNGHEHPYILALVCTVGSVLGAMFGYFIGLFGGRPIAEKFLNHKLLDKVDELFDKYGSMAILIAAFTPVPYKVFTIGAGIANMRKREFLLFSILGRGGRFFTVIFLLANFGELIMENFFKLSLAGIILIPTAFFLFKPKKK